MYIILAAIATGTSLIGMGYGILERKHGRKEAEEEKAPLQPFVVAIIVIGCLLFLLTLPTEKPFSPGQTLGPSLLLGVIAGLYALFVTLPLSAEGGVPGAVGSLS